VSQLDEVVEEIRRLMLGSSHQEVNKGKLNIGEPTAVGKQQQQHQRRGAVDSSIERFGI
jgi:hypothetical protein